MPAEQFLWDMHTHSNFSDALDYSPKQVVEIAKRAGVQVMALTDHDTTKGVPEAIEAGKENDILVVPGVEVTSLYADDITGRDGIEVHILGYGIRDSEGLDEILKPTRTARRDRVDRIISVYKEVRGVEIELRSKDSATATRESIRQSIPDEELRNHFMGDTSLGHFAYVPYEEGSIMFVGDALDLLVDHCEVAVLAHPGRLIDNYLSILKDRHYNRLANENSIPYSRMDINGVEAQFADMAGQETHLNRNMNV